MILYRRTIQITPGRQADAIARAHAFGAVWKSHGIHMRDAVAMTERLGWLCESWEFESMEAYEAAFASFQLDPHAIAIWKQRSQEIQDGVSVFVLDTMHDEFWRDA